MEKDNITDRDHKTALKMYNRELGVKDDSSTKLNKIDFGDKIITTPPINRKNKEISSNSYKHGKEINVLNSDKLYHTSKVDGLTELKGFNKSIDGVHHSEKRIYVSKNKPISRVGTDSINDNEHVYEIIKNPSKIREDNELRGNSAYYIESDKPVKVRQIK